MKPAVRAFRLASLVVAVLVVAVLVVAAPGCVTLGEHDELRAQHAKTKQTLATTELTLQKETKRAVDLEVALRREQAQLKELTAQKVALEAELQKSTASLAATIKDSSSLKASVEEMRAALDELARRKAAADARVAEYKSLLARFQTLIDAGRLKVKIVDGRMVVALASDILFASGSAGLSRDGKASITEVATLLASIPSKSFQVEGHTDNVPIKTAAFASNWELASARSLTVLKSMVDAGMPADRISAASFGDSKPAASNDTPEGKTQNRRIEIVVVPDLSSLPGFEELKKAG